MNLFLRYSSLAQGVMQVTASGTGLDVVNEQAGLTHKCWCDFLLLRIVSAHSCDEAPAEIQVVTKDCRLRRCAGYADVHTLHGLTYAWH